MSNRQHIPFLAPTERSLTPLRTSVLQRTCACGDSPGPTSECVECRRKRALQPTLRVNQPGDRYEQEADRVADAVMRRPDEPLSRAPLAIQRLDERLPVQRVHAEGEEEKDLLQTKANAADAVRAGAEAPPVVHEVLRSSGHPLDDETRGFMERRFGHDFSRVRVHAEGRASASALSVGARAYTVGRDVVFGGGQYAPGTEAGRRLLAHELTHVVQSDRPTRLSNHLDPEGKKGTPAPPILRRQPDDETLEVGEEVEGEFEIIRYQAYLRKNKDIEGMPTSGMKALALARRRLKGESVWLPKNGDALLIIELLNIAPDAEQRSAALALLEQMNTTSLLNMITRAPSDDPGKIGIWEVVSTFPADESLRVLDFFSRRFKGGFTELLKGSGKVEATEDVALEKRTLDWLATKKRSAAQYFDEVWKAHRVVLLGETHHEGPQQRRFAADMIRRHGGPDVTLAFETRQQGALDAYLKSKDTTKLPDWVVPGEYIKLLDAARATGTQVRAVDINLPSYDPGRDRNMATEIEVAEELGNKVLFYGGAVHVREVRGHHGKILGRLLAGTYGGDSYAINMEFKDTKTSVFFSMLKKRFRATRSIGFDVDESPLRWRSDPDVAKRVDLGENLDGYIYFLQ